MPVSAARRRTKVALRALCVVLGACIGLVVLVFLLNAFDESLSPEATRLVEGPQPELPPSQNGFYALIGVVAPAEEDPHAWGIRWAETLSPKMADDRRAGLDKGLKRGALALLGDRQVLCKPPCLSAARTRRQVIQTMLSDNARLLARNNIVYQYPGFENTYHPPFPHAPTIPFEGISAAHQLLLSRCALLAEGGAPARAAEMIVRDLRYARLVLGARTLSLLDKMVFAVRAARDATLLSEIVMEYRGAVLPGVAHLREEDLLLTHEERAIGNMLSHEVRGMTSFFDWLTPSGRGDDRLTGFVVWAMSSRNATINMMSRSVAGVATVDDQDGEAFISGLRKLNAENEQFYALSWRWLYNPMGKWQAYNFAEGLLEPYMLRMHDTDGLLRLVALQIDILRKGIRRKEISAYLRSTGPAVSDPYSDRPMQWDEARRQLYFAPRSDRYDKGNPPGAVVDGQPRVAVTL
jgi:hypothetical protein